MNSDESGRGAPETTLESWKEIAAYLQRNAVTVRRWEKTEGLPVHRHTHKRGASVYAFPSELDAWRETRRVAPDRVPLWKSLTTPPRSVALGLAMLLCLVMVGNGVRPPPASAQDAGVLTRMVWSGAGTDFTGQPSPDGTYLSFTDWETGNLGLHDLRIGTNRFLTANKSTAEGWADSSIPSPDGRWVAYRWSGRQGTLDPWTLRVVSAGGLAPKVLSFGADSTYGRPTAWTPDGKRLLVIRTLPDHTQQLALVSVEDGSSRSLKSLGWRYPRRVSLSPDGRYIAYDLPRDNVLAYDIHVLSVDGTSESTAVEGPANDSDPVWSADGSHLLFLSNRTGADSLWAVPIHDGRAAGPPVQLRKAVGRMYPLGMTSSGTLYYFSGGPERNVHMVELDERLRASGATVRMSERFVDDNARASWSPDGKSVAYYAPRGGAAIDVPAPTTLVIRSMETGQEQDVPMRVLPSDEDIVAPPRWFPDGRTVLVAAMNAPETTPGIGYYRVDIKTGQTELIRSTRSTEHLARNPMLSKDGNALYYFDGSLLRLDLKSGRTLDLSPWMARKRVQSPALSPDGTLIAYLSVHSYNEVAVEVMPSSGGPAREVTRVVPWSGISTRSGMTWSADGRYLLFPRSGTGDTQGIALYKVAVAGGTPEKIGVELKSGFLTYPQVDAGGRRLLFSTRELGKNEVWALENLTLKGRP